MKQKKSTEEKTANQSQVFRITTPEEQGIDSGLLISILDQIKEQNLNLHSLHIIRNGCMVLDVFYNPFERGWLHDIASCTKSFTSTLIGIALETGKQFNFRHAVSGGVLQLFK